MSKFKFKHLDNGVYGTSATPENPEFLKHVTYVVFNCLDAYQGAFRNLYFPLRRTHPGKGTPLMRTAKEIDSPEISGHTKTSLHIRYGDSSLIDWKRPSERIGDLEIYMLAPKQSISKRDFGVENFDGQGIPINKPGRLEILLPFGMLKDGKFYSDIVSLHQTILEERGEINETAGVSYSFASEYLKNEGVHIPLEGGKRHFQSKPSVVLTRGFTPDGRNWGKNSTLSNIFIDAHELFGLISVDPKAKYAKRFVEFVLKNTMVPWADWEERQAKEYKHHSFSSAI